MQPQTSDDQSFKPIDPVSDKETVSTNATAPIQVDNSAAQVESDHHSNSTSAVLFKILSIIGLVAGLVIGFGVGVMVNFGSCFKSDCSPVSGLAPFWIPLATLFITVPLVKKAFQKK